MNMAVRTGTAGFVVPDIPLYRKSDRLNLAAFYPLATHLGPGQRALIWLQGCLKDCSGCVKPEMREIVARDWVPVRTLAGLVKKLDDCEGVTLIGGEPFLQHRALAPFVELVQQAGKTVMIYTGNGYEDLLECGIGEVSRILAATDILVDGPYLIDQDHGEMWRGSANQRILFLSERYRDWEWVREAKGREVAFHLGEDGRYVILGIPGANSRP